MAEFFLWFGQETSSFGAWLLTLLLAACLLTLVLWGVITFIDVLFKRKWAYLLPVLFVLGCGLWAGGWALVELTP